MLPGCMSAWKKLWLNTCVKKIFTPFSASFADVGAGSRRRATSEIGTPWMRSITMTLAPAQVPVHLGHVQQRASPRSCA